MSQMPFTKREQAQIEESILKTTNLNIQSILKRTKYNEVIKQLCYMLGYEIIQIKTLLGNMEDMGVSFGGPVLVLDHVTSNDHSINETAVERPRRSVHMRQKIENLLAVRRKIEKCVSKVMHKKLQAMLFSGNRFLCYSKENMRMDKNSMLSNLKQIENMKLQDKKTCTATITEDAEYVADLSDIYVKRGMDNYNAVETQLDMETLEQDYIQCNKDMIHMMYRKFGKRSVAFFKNLYDASMQEQLDDQYVSVPVQCQNFLPYLMQLDLVKRHPHNDRLVRMTSF